MPVQTLDSIRQIAAADWDALLPGAAQPFLRHAFLACLEDSGSAVAATGWQPSHRLWRDAGGELRAILPAWIKSHSHGEYVFDWGWAEACQRAGIAYYPKLLTAVPFSPVVGPRLLGAPAACAQLLQAVSATLGEQGLSSWHLNFTEPAEAALLARQPGWLQRSGCQFHWFNRGYRDFQDFLDGFASRKRKQVRKERELVAGQGLEFTWLAGDELSEAQWDFVYRCYANTYWLRGQSPYLSREFFSLLAERMPAAIRVNLVQQGTRPVAMAFLLRDAECLYGRYWGCLQESANLHFETCFYQGIEQAIAGGLQRFDAGAQGEHKLVRGFEPVLTQSWHYLEHAGLRAAVADFLQEEREHVLAYLEQARQALPYRRG
ncbi:GNAT family N-acetyltransferase [Pseudomonas sp. L-22-4S-12]|uniref:GNAT family N-acetyltransferase n=1 Tax=Pseudomonas sp. L-22-4S-12 TaxID=2610893 RepID=UPI00132306AF|nr:GNAT family N-acetyltransferase [Pseudomonas sp. L-22-4S-12]MWV17993.1 GNAT family N-acetyltransferase [Pseudomonas sp. L-22-4S-12]